ncbi:MAG: hypothetical protein HDS78_03225 [Bacteroidales bacterium]|nr:hypothetical protein [Bacteroidales bacterium]
MKKVIKKIVKDPDFYNVCKEISNEEHFDIYINIDECELNGAKFEAVHIIFDGDLTKFATEDLIEIICKYTYGFLAYENAILTNRYSDEELAKLKEDEIVVSF